MTCLSPLALFQFWQRSSLACDTDLMLPVFLSTPSASTYLYAVALTLLVEIPFFLSLKWLAATRWRNALLCALACNLITHPLIHFVLLPYAREQMWLTYKFVLVAEGFALLVECTVAAWWFKKHWLKAVLMVAIANLASWGFS